MFFQEHQVIKNIRVGVKYFPDSYFDVVVEET